MVMPKQYQNKSLAGSFGSDCQGLGKCMKCREIYDSSKAYYLFENDDEKLL